MDHLQTVATAIITLKDNPFALMCLITICALGVCAFAIHAVIVALKHRGEKS